MSHEKLNVRPIALTNWRARLGYAVWSILTGIYNFLVTIYVITTLISNRTWKIGLDPARKKFRPLDPRRPLKVGVVSEYYYPHLGGLSGDVHFAAVEFAKMGYDVKLITSNVAEPHNIHHSEHGFEIIRLGRSIPVIANGSLAKISFAWNLGQQVKRMIREQKFDVIHIHCPLTPLLPLLVQRYADCPIVGHLHTLMRSKPFFYTVFQKQLSRFMNDFEGNVAVSEVCAKPFRDWFQCKFIVIPNGVPIAEFQSNAPRIPNFDDGKTNLFFIGRMEPRNGISVLIDAFRIIHREDPNTRLILAGAGPLKKFFEDSIEDRLRSHVHFIGPILEEKPQYFATADINICPTTRVASLGVTFLESMASGKPTVASDIPAFNETAEAGKEVLMADPDSPEEFAAHTLRLIREPALGAMLARRALVKMEKQYDWSIIIQRVDHYTKGLLRYDSDSAQMRAQ
jgi:phosphatidylinositol alpha-mannosyltransferase